MPRLPAHWIAHLDEGIAYRIGSCTPQGEPLIVRAVGARVLPDGRFEVLVARGPGSRVLAAVAATRQVAVVAGRPMTHRTLHVKGHDAERAPAGSEHQALLESQRRAFADAVGRFGVTPEQLAVLWFSLGWQDMDCVRFTVSGAWDQTPGPGAGGAIELLQGPGPAR